MTNLKVAKFCLIQGMLLYTRILWDLLIISKLLTLNIFSLRTFFHFEHFFTSNIFSLRTFFLIRTFFYDIWWRSHELEVCDTRNNVDDLCKRHFVKNSIKRQKRRFVWNSIKPQKRHFVKNQFKPQERHFVKNQFKVKNNISLKTQFKVKTTFR